MKNLNLYQRFATGQLDGILTRLDIARFKKYGRDQQPEYFDADPNFFDTNAKYNGITKLHKNSLRHISNHGDLEEVTSYRDGKTAHGYKVKTAHQCVIEYLQKKDMIPGEVSEDTVFSMPFSEDINQLLLIFKWMLAIQKVNGNHLSTITREDISSLGLSMTVKQLHFRLKAILDGSFVTLRYNEDDNVLEYKVGGRDSLPGTGFGYVKLKVTQYTGLLQTIQKDIENRIQLSKESVSDI